MSLKKFIHDGEFYYRDDDNFIYDYLTKEKIGKIEYSSGELNLKIEDNKKVEEIDKYSDDSDDSIILDEESEEDKPKNKNDIFNANLMFNNNFFNEFSQFKKNFENVQQNELDLDKILDEVEIDFSLPEKNKKVYEEINTEEKEQEDEQEHELDEEIVEDKNEEPKLSFIDQILEDTEIPE